MKTRATAWLDPYTGQLVGQVSDMDPPEPGPLAAALRPALDGRLHLERLHFGHHHHGGDYFVVPLPDDVCRLPR